MTSKNNDISDKSYRVLEILADGQELSQREVAQQSGLSLGMVNLILKRLLTTGYIKVANMNRKKIDYILTSKGLGEKMSRSYQYFVRAYRAFQESQSRIESLVDPLLSQGHRRFIIVGEGEIAKLLEMILRTRGGEGIEIRLSKSGTENRSTDELVLDCRYGQSDGPIGVSVLEGILNVSKPQRKDAKIAVPAVISL